MVTWYAFAATGLLFEFLDLAAPRYKVVGTADFPCAHHDCQCRTAEECRNDCCCFPKEMDSAPPCASCPSESRDVQVTHLSSTACRGGAGDPAAQAKLKVHVPSGARLATFESVVAWLDESSCRPHPPVHASPPDKIPI